MKGQQSGRRGIWVAIAVALICLVGGRLFLTSNLTAGAPSYRWTITGYVVDENERALSDVRIAADGQVRVTWLDRFLQKPPAEFHKEVKTDEAGKFAMDFKAFRFFLRVNKEGYEQEELEFYHISGRRDSLNQDLQIQLKPVGAGL